MKARLLLGPLFTAAILVSALLGTPVASAATKPCAASGLVVWAGEEPGGGAAGSVYYRLEFTNLSARTCTIAGFPTVSAVDLNGRRIGTAATHSPGKKVGAVKLAQGQTATAQLQIVDALNYPAGKCKATWAAGLRIGIPGGSGAKTAPLAFRTCALASAKILVVGAIAATVTVD
jgi:Protein of unknown function (DUF4232)